ncbi:hypothetical protein HZC31_02655 [Candidatus Woesearchaeota archaeon]|nr:hypothetical protein [Candidatus Woesearchaeota archaeon]
MTTLDMEALTAYVQNPTPFVGLRLLKVIGIHAHCETPSPNLQITANDRNVIIRTGKYKVSLFDNLGNYQTSVRLRSDTDLEGLAADDYSVFLYTGNELHKYSIFDGHRTDMMRVYSNPIRFITRTKDIVHCVVEDSQTDILCSYRTNDIYLHDFRTVRIGTTPDQTAISIGRNAVWSVSADQKMLRKHAHTNTGSAPDETLRVNNPVSSLYASDDKLFFQFVGVKRSGEYRFVDLAAPNKRYAVSLPEAPLACLDIEGFMYFVGSARHMAFAYVPETVNPMEVTPVVTQRFGTNTYGRVVSAFDTVYRLIPENQTLELYEIVRHPQPRFKE